MMDGVGCGPPVGVMDGQIGGAGGGRERRQMDG